MRVTPTANRPALATDPATLRARIARVSNLADAAMRRGDAKAVRGNVRECQEMIRRLRDIEDQRASQPAKDRT
jgi:hypothetical protein